MRVPKTFDAMNSFPCPETKDFDCLMILRRKKQAATLDIEAEMIEVA
jgi:hypothetical protein